MGPFLPSEHSALLSASFSSENPVPFGPEAANAARILDAGAPGPEAAAGLLAGQRTGCIGPFRPWTVRRLRSQKVGCQGRRIDYDKVYYTYLLWLSRNSSLKTPDSLTETDLQGTFPAILVRAGKAACFAADEFFSARISNSHTRTAYAHQVSRFLTWCENEGLELHQVTPGLAGRFLDELPGAAPTQNQALAALRHFFDVLVARHAAVLNPFQSVRGVRHPHGEGRTPEVSVDQARQSPRLHQDGSTCTGFGTGRSSGRSSTPAPGSGPSAGSGCRTCEITATTGRCSLRKKGARSGRSRCATTWTSGSRPTSRGAA